VEDEGVIADDAFVLEDAGEDSEWCGGGKPVGGFDIAGGRGKGCVGGVGEGEGLKEEIPDVRGEARGFHWLAVKVFFKFGHEVIHGSEERSGDAAEAGDVVSLGVFSDEGEEGVEGFEECVHMRRRS